MGESALRAQARPGDGVPLSMMMAASPGGWARAFSRPSGWTGICCSKRASRTGKMLAAGYVRSAGRLLSGSVKPVSVIAVGAMMWESGLWVSWVSCVVRCSVRGAGGPSLLGVCSN